MTVVLSGFADEISPHPGEQLEVLAAESITHLELRSMWSVNVADLSDSQVARIGAVLDDAGVRVSAIGSPVGKSPVDAPFSPEIERLRRIADIAGRLGARIVRVFSFYLPPGEPPGRFRDQVIDRLARLAEVAEEHGLVLAAENEKGSTATGRSAVPTWSRPWDRRRCGRRSTRRTSCSAGCGRSTRPTRCSGRTWSMCRSRMH
jgi:sugar phosphate isomerase/epimerase